MQYSRAEAKEWASANWRGVCNVIMPSFSADLRRLNEAGIRHDVRRNIELGFWGALLVSECGTSDEEYRRFMEIAVDEAKGRQHFLIHGTFDTREQIIAMAQGAARRSASAAFCSASRTPSIRAARTSSTSISPASPTAPAWRCACSPPCR